MWLFKIKLLKIKYYNKNSVPAMAGVAQWIERGPANQTATGSIPSHMPGLQGRSPVGGMLEATIH